MLMCGLCLETDADNHKLVGNMTSLSDAGLSSSSSN